MKLLKVLWEVPLEYASALLYFHKKRNSQIYKLKYKGHQDIGQFWEAGTPKI
jgi:hypothetical protein